MELLPLHRYKQFINSCADILNKQWPRSMGARLHSFSKSCDTLPVCLALVNHEDVIGFSKLSAVQGKNNSCLLESVLVREKDRGKGFGKILMDLTQKYAHGIGMETIFLNTIDKEGFYAHLGYVKCKPVLSLGENAHRVPDSMLQHFMVNNSSDKPYLHTKSDIQDDGNNINNVTKTLNNVVLSDSGSMSADDFITGVSKPQSKASPAIGSSSTTAAASSPPPPPPPAPPMPSPSAPATQHQTKNISISRLDPKCVIWMKKDISFI